MNKGMKIQSKMPGHVLQNNKGKPSFFSFFQKLYEDLEKKIFLNSDFPLNNSHSPFVKEIEELFEVSKKMFLYYSIDVNLTQKCSHDVQTYSVFLILLGIIYSFPRDFFVKLQLGTVYFYMNNIEALKKVPGVREENILIISNLKSEEDIAKKLHQLIKTSLSKSPSLLGDFEALGQKQNQKERNSDDLKSQDNLKFPLQSCLRSSRRRDSVSSIGSQGIRDSPRRVSFEGLLPEERTGEKKKRKSQFGTQILKA